MISVEQAVKIALEYVQKLFGEDPARPVSGFRLEEVEARDDGSWDITVSFYEGAAVERAARSDRLAATDPLGQAPSGKATLGIDLDRSFKIVEISGDGRVKSVKMRPIVVG